MTAGDQRQVYLITYSRADVAKIPSRERFAEVVLEAWGDSGVRVQHWVVCLEAHASSNTNASVEINNAYHFHMALKLVKRARWLQVRKYLDQKHGIQVNFSDNHTSYYSAYCYVTKEDREIVHSSNHPDLSEPPKTERAIAGKKRKAKSKLSGGDGIKRKRKRLSVYQVINVIKAKQISCRLELVRLAVQQEREGMTSLAEFIANRGYKVVEEALALAKEFSVAEEKFERAKKTRIQLLEENSEGECSKGCEGKWFTAATALLERHGILVSSFCQAIYTALLEGRGKYRNIYIYGASNTGKTFILSPLKKIYHAFCNPATGSFAWVGAQECEIIVLNDFRWSPTIIAWADFLQALEGDTVHLPAPKNFCRQDIEFTKDAPFFATSDAPLVLVKGGCIDRANSQMMDVRWRFFHFWKQIPPSEQEQIPACGRCFAKFILESK